LERSGKHDRIEECMGRRRYRRSLQILVFQKDMKKIKALPLNIAWGVWLERNLNLFEGKETHLSNVRFRLAIS